MDAIMKRIIKRKEDYFGVPPAYTPRYKNYPLEKVEESNDPDAETA